MSMSPVSGSAQSASSKAILADHDFGQDKVFSFSRVNMKAGTIPAGTLVTVLGPSGFSGHIFVMTQDGNVFEVWHENLKYLGSRSSNFKLN